jgi:hypothetical protein
LRTDRAILAALLFAALPVMGQQVPEATFEVEMRDPWVPPALRSKSTRAAQEGTRGQALEAQVERKLRARFTAAASPDGTLTREQARSAGLGAIAADFAAIDRSGRGAIRFEDWQRYLREKPR